ncbi:unnamed protein product [Amoebophrya sp. A120]|nr:unnamed protein product [Amoebophrya sp. A120]|eukprot:GSA120T00003839001.1
MSDPATATHEHVATTGTLLQVGGDAIPVSAVKSTVSNKAGVVKKASGIKHRSHTGGAARFERDSRDSVVFGGDKKTFRKTGFFKGKEGLKQPKFRKTGFALPMKEVLTTNEFFVDYNAARAQIEREAMHRGVPASFTTTQKNAGKQIFHSKKGPAATEGESFCNALERSAELAPDRAALLVERPLPEAGTRDEALPLEQWSVWTYQEYRDDVRSMAISFLNDLKPLKDLPCYQKLSELERASWLENDLDPTVCIFGFNAPEWSISAMAAIYCAGLFCGIYPTDTQEQVQYKVDHSNASVVVVDMTEGEKKYQAVADSLENCPTVQLVLVWGEMNRDQFFGPGKTEKEFTRSDGSVVIVRSWTAQLQRGRDNSDDDSELIDRMESIDPSQCCCLVYTSGTTGWPKGVMLSHDNLSYSGAAACDPEYGWHRTYGSCGEERLVSYLPLSHIAGTICDLLAPLYVTALGRRNKLNPKAEEEGDVGYVSVYFVRPYDMRVGTMKNRILLCRPTVFFGVPRVYEKLMMGVQLVLAKKTKGYVGGCIGALINRARRACLKTYRAMEHDNLDLIAAGDKTALQPNSWSSWWEKILIFKIRKNLGLDQTRIFMTGAAPMPPAVQEFFLSFGIRVSDTYGMSESCAAVTVSQAESSTPMLPVDFYKNLSERRENAKCGVLGKPQAGAELAIMTEKAPGVFVRCPPASNIENPELDSQGEICYRGRHIMLGYLANPRFGADHVREIEEKNRATIDQDGWLHSGDKGCQNFDGFVKLTGRYKELLISAGGENIAPVPIEQSLKALVPGVSNVVMIGDKRQYNVILVTLLVKGNTGELPGTNELMGPALQVSPNCATTLDARDDAIWKEKIESAIKKVNADSVVCANNAWKVQKFAILPRDFSVETGELTGTMKLKRDDIARIWADEIEKLY